MTYFTDQNLGNLFPDTLQHAGLTVERLNDHFPPDTHDDVWIPEIASRGWVAISRDQKIRYRQNERDMAMRAGLRLFILIGPKATHKELAENFIACRSKVERFIENHPFPFIAKVYLPQGKSKSGHVELWLSEQEWREKTQQGKA